jgi:TM2 domain-containing membrane protein YozV
MPITQPSKSPVVAALLSGLIPGLGQLYNKQWVKGMAYLVGVIVLTATLGRIADPSQLAGSASTGAPLDHVGQIVILLLLLLGLVIWSMVDAARVARRS